MTQIKAAITGVGAYVPDYILTNDELSTMVDTSDEWIMTRIGIKERRIRITSYNVCYTKLLRILLRPEKLQNIYKY